MGGLVARTFLSENPAVGRPHRGDVPRRHAESRLGQGDQDARRRPGRPEGKRDQLSRVAARIFCPAPSMPTSPSWSPSPGPASTNCCRSTIPAGNASPPTAAARASARRTCSRVGPWQPYWPSAELERRIFLDDWLKKREAEGRKKIDLPDWEFCQDPDLRAVAKNPGAGPRLAPAHGQPQLHQHAADPRRASRRA